MQQQNKTATTPNNKPSTICNNNKTSKTCNNKKTSTTSNNKTKHQQHPTTKQNINNTQQQNKTSTTPNNKTKQQQHPTKNHQQHATTTKHQQHATTTKHQRHATTKQDISTDNKSRLSGPSSAVSRKSPLQCIPLTSASWTPILVVHYQLPPFQSPANHS